MLTRRGINRMARICNLDWSFISKDAQSSMDFDARSILDPEKVKNLNLTFGELVMVLIQRII